MNRSLRTQSAILVPLSSETEQTVQTAAPTAEGKKVVPLESSQTEQTVETAASTAEGNQIPEKNKSSKNQHMSIRFQNNCLLCSTCP
jgi:hypothetical protein